MAKLPCELDSSQSSYQRSSTRNGLAEYIHKRVAREISTVIIGEPTRPATTYLRNYELSKCPENKLEPTKQIAKMSPRNELARWQKRKRSPHTESLSGGVPVQPQASPINNNVNQWLNSSTTTQLITQGYSCISQRNNPATQKSCMNKFDNQVTGSLLHCRERF